MQKTKKLILISLIAAMAFAIVGCGGKADEGSSSTSSGDETLAEAGLPTEGIADAIYVPGTYTTSFILNDNMVVVEVTVDETNINDIQLVEENEAIATMYPLIQPSFNDLANQVLANQSFENITFPDDSKYTSMILLNAIATTVNKAVVSSDTP